MVCVNTHPPGVSIKSLPTLGANTSQSPIANTPPSMVTPVVNLNSREVFQNLIESIEAHIQMARKLNMSKGYHRLDQNNLEVFSDDDVELDLPNFNSFMNIANSPSEEPPGDQVPRDSGDLQNMVTGANVKLADENATSMMQNMMDNNWQ